MLGPTYDHHMLTGDLYDVYYNFYSMPSPNSKPIFSYYTHSFISYKGQDIRILDLWDL